MRKEIAVGITMALAALTALWWMNRGENKTTPDRDANPAANLTRQTTPVAPVSPALARVTRVPRVAQASQTPRPAVDRDALMEQLFRATDDPAISKTIRTAIGLDKERGYARRIKAVHELPHTLPPKAIEVLSLFVQLPYSKDDGLREIEHEALRNDVMEKLTRQDNLPPGLGTLLVELYRDPKQGDVWRDYCVQFFSTYYERKWKADAVDEGDSERAAMLQAFEDALRETDKTIAGTALLAVDRLSANYGEFSRAAIASNAVLLAANDAAFAPIRMTALLVCEQHGVRDALPTARILAQTGENTHLRMVAIKTLGSMGEPRDEELLKSMAKDPDTNVAAVAAMALARVGGERRE